MLSSRVENRLCLEFSGVIAQKDTPHPGPARCVDRRKESPAQPPQRANYPSLTDLSAVELLRILARQVGVRVGRRHTTTPQCSRTLCIW